MIAGVAIDPWKLDIFRRHLTDAGFEYTEHPGGQITVLRVKCDYVHKLKPIIEAAQRECADVEPGERG